MKTFNPLIRFLSKSGLLFFLFLGSQVQAQQVKSAQQTDTIIGFNFVVNMSKAVQDGVFKPDSGVVDVVLDQEIPVLRLVPEAGYKYSGSISTGLDSGMIYHYKYRINDTVWETVTRTALAGPGYTKLNDWWNNEVLNTTIFEVNMGVQVSLGNFDPLTDHVHLLGTMNDWQGSPAMELTDSVHFLYSVTYPLDPGSIQEYKFRINQDSSGLELINLPNRMLLVKPGALAFTHDFDNMNPAKLPMTFHCNMKYFIQASHFDPLVDFLDVAGNFNLWNGQDVLFNVMDDSIYTTTLFLDTTWIHNGPLEFKFRINGDWNTAERYGKPNRTYDFHDTIGGNPNVFSCWYDDKDPGIPTPPWVYQVGIQGKVVQKQVLSGYYSYENVNGIPEGISLYNWYQSTDSLGIHLIPIDSAWHITYTVDTTDIGKWLVFEVIPVAASGDSAIGKAVRVVTPNKAGTVGIGETGNSFAMVYPNPCRDIITIVSLSVIEKIELFSYTGVKIMNLNGIRQKTVRMDLGMLPPGLYYLQAYGRNQESGVIKVIRY